MGGLRRCQKAALTHDSQDIGCGGQHGGEEQLLLSLKSLEKNCLRNTSGFRDFLGGNSVATGFEKGSGFVQRVSSLIVRGLPIPKGYAWPQPIAILILP